jgi:ABC-type nickel/cobalt efflux system permease component RcnA
MWTIATILLIAFGVWLMFEAWRAPKYRQDEKGNFKQTEPMKKLSDIFKKNKNDK